MELLFAIAAALLLIVIVFKLLKGIARTVGLLVIAGFIGYFLFSNGAFA